MIGALLVTLAWVLAFAVGNMLKDASLMAESARKEDLRALGGATFIASAGALVAAGIMRVLGL